MNDNLPPMAFKDRCTVAVECLPNAPYRTMLANLLDEMLAAVEKDRERKSVPAGFDEWAKSQGYGPSMLRTHAQAGWNAAMLAAAPQPQPDRQALQAEGKHPAPCARFCEATAFNIKIRGLEAQLKALAQPQPVQEPVAPVGTVTRYLGNDGYMKWAFQPEAAAWLVPRDQRAAERGAESCFSVYTSPQAQPLTEADPFTYVIQHLNSSPYALTKDECITKIKELRALYQAQGEAK